MVTIGSRNIGEGFPCFIVCELSANHVQRFENAVELIKQAKAVGADAVKVQLYTPSTHTLPLETSDFQITHGLWSGNSLWNLYEHTCMPWVWYPELLQLAQSLELTLFPSVSDLTALEYAEQHNTPAYKIPSFDIGDRTLLRRVAETGKPMFISMGCATEDDVDFIQGLSNKSILMLHCVSEYPATARTTDIESACYEYDGLSDHTAGIGLPILCATNDAHVIEKHIWLGRGQCADQEFSLSPTEFKTMVDAIHAVETTQVEMSKSVPRTKPSTNFQRSIYAVRDIKNGDALTTTNIRLIRPGYGLDPRLYEIVLGKSATMDIPYGTALKGSYYK